MTGDDDTTGGEPAWHERSSTVLGASVGALIVLAILFYGVSCVARQFNEPEQAPSYYIVPTTSGSGTSSSATSTSETITSTMPPLTSDINPGDTTTSSSTDTSSSDSSSRGRPPQTTDEDGETTTRSRPRLNETRTLYPRP